MHRFRPRRALPSLVFAALLAGCSGSGTAEQEACLAICDSFADCVSAIDVSECAHRCSEHALVDDAYAVQADACERCVSGRACMESTNCWQSCPVLMPGD